MLRSLRSIEISSDSRLISLIFIVSSLEISTWHLFICLFIYLFIIRFNLKFEIYPVNVSRCRRREIGYWKRTQEKSSDRCFVPFDRSKSWLLRGTISLIFIVSSKYPRGIYLFIYLFIIRFNLKFEINPVNVFRRGKSGIRNAAFDQEKSDDRCFVPFDRSKSRVILELFPLSLSSHRSKYPRGIYLFIIRFNLKFEINSVNVSRRRRKKSGIGNAAFNQEKSGDRCFVPFNDQLKSWLLELFPLSLSSHRSKYPRGIYLFIYYSFQFEIWD